MTRFNFFVEFFRHIKGSVFVLIAPEYRGVGGNVRQQISFVVVYDVSEGFFHHWRQRAVILAAFKPFPKLFQDFMQQNFQAVFYPPSGLNSRAVHQHEFFDFFGILCRNVNRNPPAERIYAGFDMLFSILFPILFLVVLGMILYTIIGNISTWNKNNHSPRLTVPATVVAKRTEVSRHHTDDTMAHTFTTYYVTFQVESGDRMELTVSGSDYGMLVEGDIGKLSFQGTRYLGFERS